MQVMDIQVQTQKTDSRNLFILLSSINLIVSLDHGIIPAGKQLNQLSPLASVQIQNSLGIDNYMLGLLGSLVYAGTVVMGVIASYLFLKFNPQRIIGISLMVMILSLFGFTLDFEYQWLYFFFRFCTGAGQAAIIVYFPVWVDTFGGERKTVWLTYLQSGVPIGVFVGYVISSIISTKWNWRWAFYLQILVLIPCTYLFAKYKNDLIDVRPHMKNKDNQYERMPYFSILCLILQDKPYCFITISLGFLYFCVTGIQFWITNYLVQVLNIDQLQVNTVFSFDSITAPISGCILGGIVTQRLGGYDSLYAHYIVLVSGLFSSAAALFVPFLDNFWVIGMLIWIILFFGGAIVPILTGMVISSVNEGLRSFANSNTTTYVNLFGYLPAPMMYGYLTQFGPRAGMLCLMLCPLAGMTFMVMATYYSFRKQPLVVERSDQSLEQNPASQRSSESKIEEISKRFRSPSEDLISQVFEFHTVPITAKIGTSLHYEKSN